MRLFSLKSRSRSRRPAVELLLGHSVGGRPASGQWLWLLGSGGWHQTTAVSMLSGPGVQLRGLAEIAVSPELPQAESSALLVAPGIRVIRITTEVPRSFGGQGSIGVSADGVPGLLESQEGSGVLTLALPREMEPPSVGVPLLWRVGYIDDPIRLEPTGLVEIGCSPVEVVGL